VERRSRLDHHEDTRLTGRSAVGRDDRIPLAGTRDAGDAGLDPAEGTRVVEALVQESCGSMSP
jgi:hypothetical protein